MARTIKHFILSHTIWINISSEADHYQSLFFGHDSLVDMPAGDKMRKNNGTHVERFVEILYLETLKKVCSVDAKIELMVHQTETKKN